VSLDIDDLKGGKGLTLSPSQIPQFIYALVEDNLLNELEKHVASEVFSLGNPDIGALFVHAARNNRSEIMAYLNSSADITAQHHSMALEQVCSNGASDALRYLLSLSLKITGDHQILCLSHLCDNDDKMGAKNFLSTFRGALRGDIALDAISYSSIAKNQDKPYDMLEIVLPYVTGQVRSDNARSCIIENSEHLDLSIETLSKALGMDTAAVIAKQSDQEMEVTMINNLYPMTQKPTPDWLKTS